MLVDFDDLLKDFSNYTTCHSNALLLANAKGQTRALYIFCSFVDELFKGKK